MGLLAALTACGANYDNSAEDPDWPLDGRDEGNTHFSPLEQINANNVGELGIAWVVDIPTPDGMVGTPLIADGVIYQTGSMSRIFANDLKTGKLLWEFGPEIVFSGAQAPGWGARARRGLALCRDLVLVATPDCRLIAVKRADGTQAWEADVCSGDDEMTITAAPHVGDDKVFVGPANSDMGTRRGFVDAFDAKTGEKLWRFYTAPGDPAEDAKSADPEALKRARATWGEGYKPMGMSVWESMHYDPETELLYLGVGGPVPYSPLERGKNRGEELFSNSIVAVHPDTGKYVWHFQVTPNDAWNFEAIEQITTVDMEINKKARRVLMQASKNGFLHVLDARSGELISAKNFVPITWATGRDSESGRPIQNPEAQYYNYPGGSVAVKPNGAGAHGMQRMAFSPQTGLLYIPALDAAQTWYEKTAVGEHQARGDALLDVADHAESARVPLIAWDPATQTKAWEVDRPVPINGGVLATGGDLVFQGLGNGRIEAYHARTGERLWSFDTGSAIMAAPVTVGVDGVQYLIVSVGNGGGYMVNRGYRPLFDTSANSGPARLIAFKLGGKIDLPPSRPIEPLPKPVLPRPNPQIAAQGALSYKFYCMICHGAQARGMRGSVPDLRRTGVSTHDVFDQIVLQGLLVSNGMPRFDDVLDERSAHAVQAYILERSWIDYERQQREQTSLDRAAPK
jgi:quinohemoprotein ethanol dehydrogenase